MKLPLLAALTALSLWGCSSQSANMREASSPQAGATGGSGSVGDSASTDDRESKKAAAEVVKEEEQAQESPLQSSDVTKKERRDRMGAPTVYDGEATGGSGSDTTVTTGDGEKWDVQDEPGFENNEPRTTNEKEDATGGSGNEGDPAATGEGTTGGSVGGTSGGTSGGGGSGGSGGGGGGGGGGF